MAYQFENRIDAGKQLAEALMEYKGRRDVLLLALPRGGVPVADEVSKALELPLDVLLVRKLGVPGHEEVAMGAIAWDHICYINNNLVDQLDIPGEAIKRVIAKEKAELLRRSNLYRDDLPPPEIKGRTVIVIDDGLATGATMHAAIAVLQHEKAARIVVAVPVGSSDTCRELEADADEIVCLYNPEPFYSVGQWYRDFSQTSDSEVQDILDIPPQSAGSHKQGRST